MSECGAVLARGEPEGRGETDGRGETVTLGSTEGFGDALTLGASDAFGDAEGNALGAGVGAGELRRSMSKYELLASAVSRLATVRTSPPLNFPSVLSDGNVAAGGWPTGIGS